MRGGEEKEGGWVGLWRRVEREEGGEGGGRRERGYEGGREGRDHNGKVLICLFYRLKGCHHHGVLVVATGGLLLRHCWLQHC